jgi:hypothetical protein
LAQCIWPEKCVLVFTPHGSLHLLFANDCIIFSEALQRGVEWLKDILEIYSRGSGQLVNREKSAVFYRKNCDEDMKSEVGAGLDIPNEALTEKYLGLPTALGWSTQGVFEYLPGKVKRLIGSYSGNQASCVGCEVLLKSVAQAIPPYPMNCFLAACW